MKFVSVVVALLLLCAVGFSSEVPPTKANAKMSSSELLLPANYHDWVTISPATAGLPSHHQKHVASKLFVEPTAFEHFTRTGEWPNKTVIVLELSSAKAKARTKLAVMGLEAAVKDESGFPDQWSYYGIVYDRPQVSAGNMKAEKPCDCDQPLDSMLAMAFPTLRAVINAKPSSMSKTLF
jgi:hypothetical protein